MVAATSISPRSLCITRDVGLRRTLRRTISAAGAEVEFCDDLSEAKQGDAQLLFVDSDVWRAADSSQLLEVLADGGKLVVLGDSMADDEVVALLRNDRFDHVIGHRDGSDDTELLVTSVKLLSGEIFGLEKYLAWGVKIHEVEVRSYADKRRALDAVAAQARQVGARRSVLARIESATDELLMNAIYDAPAAREGGSLMSRVEAAGDDDAPLTDEPALLRFACDGRHFAVSVQDNYGELHKRAILDHLSRARSERGRPKVTGEDGSGAGLGLYFIMSSASRFIANIAPKQRTEVICLFDLDQSGRRAPAGARSIHIFSSDDPVRGESDAA